MEKELKDMEISELQDYHVGNSILALGRGDSFRSIVRDIMRVTLQWKEERKNIGK